MDFEIFLRTVLPERGFNWTRFKKPMIRRRLAARMAQLQVVTWDDYGELVNNSVHEQSVIHQILCVSISRFWRNRAFFTQLSKRVFPELLNSLEPDEAVIVWSAGGASGQEALSVTMLYASLPSEITDGHKLIIVSSDVDSRVLARARNNRWTQSEIREVPQDIGRRFFTRDRDGILMLRDDHIRTVYLIRHDLFLHPPINYAHLVLCRNSVMTYMSGSSRKKIMARVVSILRAGGYLALGRKEAIPADWMNDLNLKHGGGRLYQRVDSSTR